MPPFKSNIVRIYEPKTMSHSCLVQCVMNEHMLLVSCETIKVVVHVVTKYTTTV